MARAHLILPVTALFFAACSATSGPLPDGSADGGAQDFGSPSGTRGYRLASTGTELVMDAGLLFQELPANLSTDVDVYPLFGEFYGVPWDELAAGGPPPVEWANAWTQLAATANATGKPILLEIRPSLAGDLTAKAIVSNGQLTTKANWTPTCFDFANPMNGAAMKRAYVSYVDWLVKTVRPRWLVHAVEANTFQTHCDLQWSALVEVINAAYDQAKVEKPDVIAFPSFQIDTLYGYGDCPSAMTQPQCFQANYPKILTLKRDRFGVSTYPYLMTSIRTVANVPADYFIRAASLNRAGPERVVITETGWNSEAIVGQFQSACTTAISASEADELAWLNRVLSDAEAQNIELVNWWSNRDLFDARLMTDCPCSFDASWCQYIQVVRAAAGSDPTAQYLNEVEWKIFGAMGLRGYDGRAKPLVYPRWQQALGLPTR